MMSQLSKQENIAKQVIDGSITIDSIREFEGILQIFPNDPMLYSAFSDLLLRKKSFDKAAESYQKSADLFIACGKMLPAIFCKIHQWRLKKPSSKEVNQFHSALLDGNYHEFALNIFLSRLSFSEFVALINRMQQVRLATGQTIKKIGDAEEALFWVVSGSLKSTIYQPLIESESDHQKSTIYLSENDFFGDIYPFEVQKLSQSYTQTASRVELIKLSKTGLVRACKKYPNIELGIIELVNARSNGTEKGVPGAVRKTERHKLPLRMNLKIYPDALSHHPVILDGYSRDVSVGGMCIVLDAKYANIPAVYKSIKNAKIEISLPGEALTMNVTGDIAWNKEVYREGQKTVALGIQFEEMSPKLSGLLVVFADILSKQESSAE